MELKFSDLLNLIPAAIMGFIWYDVRKQRNSVAEIVKDLMQYKLDAIRIFASREEFKDVRKKLERHLEKG